MMNLYITRIRRIMLPVALMLFSGLAASAAVRVEHRVSIPAPGSPTLHVVTEIKEIKQPQIELGIPNWAPGYYTTADFSRNMARLTFQDLNGKALRHRKSQDSLWLLDTEGASGIHIEFDYYAGELDLNRTTINTSYAILNGINFLFYIKGHTQDIPATVQFKLPDGWRIATGLTPTGPPAEFRADSYDQLADCPVLVGEFDEVPFSVRNIPHHLAVAPKGAIRPADLKALADADAKVIEAQAKVTGEIPYDQYWLIHVVNGDAEPEGLEHNNSYFGILPKPDGEQFDIEPLVELTSHEFFHAYNGKRIRPAELWPYRYQERSYTPLLWFVEGVTEYYAWRGLLRAGLVSEDEYRKKLLSIIASVNGVEAAKYISLEEASVNTWLGTVGGGGQRFAVDYYYRGYVIGLLLDLGIRRDSGGAASLDDVMRRLYQDYYKKNRGFTTTDLIAVINQITGKNYQSFFDRFVGGTESLPYNDMLAGAGLQLEEQKTRMAQFGVGIGQDNVIAALASGSLAETVGVKVGDVFEGIADFDATDKNWRAEFRAAYAQKGGEPVVLRVRRGGKPLTFDLKVLIVEKSNWNLNPLPQATEPEKKVLQAWLGGK